MSEPSHLRIHEFSTGIKAAPANNANGWLSWGFTGEWMHSTLDEIPKGVQGAIDNRWFAIAEGSHADDPALVGRVVGSWSVIAIVTRGEDNYGRFFSAYRYFLCQGEDNLWRIIQWLYVQGKPYPKLIPTFDPFDQHRETPEFYACALKKKHGYLDQSDQDYRNQRLLMPGTYSLLNEQGNLQAVNLQKINELAEWQQDGKLTSWAFNVRGLKLPEKFKVVLPANQEAYDLIQETLQQALNAPTTTPSASTLPMREDSQGIIVEAIHQLQNSVDVEKRSLLKLEQELRTGISEEHWRAIFQELRVVDSWDRVHARDVRLLTLQAIFLPETLLDYFEWLRVRDYVTSGNSSTKLNESLSFQAKILQILLSSPYEFTALNEQIKLGASSLVLALMPQSQTQKHTHPNRDEVEELVVWAFRDNGSIWSDVAFPLAEEILYVPRITVDPPTAKETVLQSIKSKKWAEFLYALYEYKRFTYPPMDQNRKFWQKMHQELFPDADQVFSIDPRYGRVARLFKALAEDAASGHADCHNTYLKVTGILQQISQGLVCSDVFASLYPSQQKYPCIKLPKEVRFKLLNQAWIEDFTRAEKRRKLWRSLSVPFRWIENLLVSIAKGILTPFVFLIDQLQGRRPQATQQRGVHNNQGNGFEECLIILIIILLLVCVVTLVFSQTAPNPTLNSNFLHSKSTLQSIISELHDDNPRASKQLQALLDPKGKAGVSNLLSLDSSKIPEDKQQTLLTAIREYQQRRGLNADEILSNNGATKLTLKCDIMRQNRKEIPNIAPIEECKKEDRILSYLDGFDPIQTLMLSMVRDEIEKRSPRVSESHIETAIIRVIDGSNKLQFAQIIPNSKDIDPKVKRDWADALYKYLETKNLLTPSPNYYQQMASSLIKDTGF